MRMNNNPSEKIIVEASDIKTITGPCNSSLSYREVDDYSKVDNLPAYLGDIVSLIPKDYTGPLIAILMIHVPSEHRRKGIGSALLKSLIDSNKDRIICALAAPTIFDYPVEPSSAEYDAFLSEIPYFYSPNKFKPFNMLCNYEFSIPYLYTGNTIGTQLYSDIEEYVKDWEKNK